MALETTDINMRDIDGWVAVVLTGTVVHITEVLGNEVMCRFDIASESAGFAMSPGDTLSCEQTVYVKSRYSNRKSSIIIVKD